MIDDKKLWEIYPHIWATESAYMSWLRGGIRRYLWSKNPVKLEFIKQNRVKIPNPNPRGKVKEVWGGVCALTGNTYPIGDMEVDHKEGNHSLKTLDDLVPFVKGIVMITLDDLQLVSKEAHKIKSYAEKQGIPFEEAKAEKTAIELIKKGVDKQFLIDHNVKAENIGSTQAVRRKQIVEILLELNKLKEKINE
jgi:hypothetical protein